MVTPHSSQVKLFSPVKLKWSAVCCLISSTSTAHLQSEQRISVTRPAVRLGGAGADDREGGAGTDDREGGAGADDREGGTGAGVDKAGWEVAADMD